MSLINAFHANINLGITLPLAPLQYLKLLKLNLHYVFDKLSIQKHYAKLCNKWLNFFLCYSHYVYLY
jgi:hypothetical protein